MSVSNGINHLRAGSVELKRSRSLSAVSSPCSAEPNTRTPLTRWRSAISRICVRCRERASEGRIGPSLPDQAIYVSNRSLATVNTAQTATKNVANSQPTAATACRFNSSSVLPLAAFHSIQPLEVRKLSLAPFSGSRAEHFQTNVLRAPFQYGHAANKNVAKKSYSNRQVVCAPR